MSEDIVIGIDLGTTNTLAYYLKQGKPTAIRFPGSKIMLPSVIYVDKDQNVLVGKEAQRSGVADPKNMVRSAKTYMGSVTKTWTCNGKTFTPTDVATEVLKKVRAVTLKKMKADDDATIKAVITVPAYFHSDQIRETKTAGERAGLEVVRIITEPMAAALAAAKIMELNEKVLVVDLGGGTFDLSALEARQSDHSYRTIDIAGDAKLGGDDFDNCVYQELKDVLLDDKGINLASEETSGLSTEVYHRVCGDLREAATNAKIDLSDEDSTVIALPNLLEDDGHGHPYNFEYTLKRDRFYEICQPLFDKIIGSVKAFVNKGDKFRKDEISKIILAGGSCYIPKIRDDVEQFLGMKANTELPLDTLVAIGACFVANHEVSGLDDDTIEDILSHALGIDANDKQGKQVLSVILPAGSTLPATASRDYTTTQDHQMSIVADIYEEADEMALDDLSRQHYLGCVTLDNIPPVRAGKPKIRVTFQYDVNHILTAEAEDMDTHQKRTVTIDKQTDAAPAHHAQVQPIDIMLMLDTSWSMNGEPIRQAVAACNTLVDDMIDFSVHRMGFIAFNSFVRMRTSLTDQKSNLRQAIYNGSTTDGSTDMVRAFREAKEILDKESQGRKRVCILVTDGNPDNEYPTIELAEQLRKDGIRIVVIGAGNSDQKVIHAIASKGEDYKISNMSKLAETFGEVVARLGEL